METGLLLNRPQRPVRSGRSLLRRWRWLDIFLTLALFALIGAAVLRLNAIERVAMLGVPKVVDGDSLELNGKRLRLEGIDAPEMGQICGQPGRTYDCGRAAREHLRKLTDSGKLNCSGWQRDKYERLLSVCRTGSHEINREMVRSGWAIAYGGYAAEEASARSAKRGVWQGDFDRPQDWRRMKGSLLETPHDMWLTVRGYLAALFGFQKG